VTVTLAQNGQSVPHEHRLEGNRLIVSLASDLLMDSGDQLTMTIE
jgi:hypothetical protein